MSTDSFLSFVGSLFFKLFQLVNNFSEKLLIHEFNYAVFFSSVALLPTLLYAIKQIPLRYTVYSEDAIEKLDSYEYQLSRLKLTYNRLSQEMNMAALNQASFEQVGKTAQDFSTDPLGAM